MVLDSNAVSIARTLRLCREACKLLHSKFMNVIDTRGMHAMGSHKVILDFYDVNLVYI